MLYFDIHTISHVKTVSDIVIMIVLDQTLETPRPFSLPGDSCIPAVTTTTIMCLISSSS
jgi:hypothetical protein